jgi:hypothetical protein
MKPCSCCGEYVELVTNYFCKLCDTFINADLDIEYPDDE